RETLLRKRCYGFRKQINTYQLALSMQTQDSSASYFKHATDSWVLFHDNRIKILLFSLFTAILYNLTF
ncbi:MAG: hypothetical protein ABIN04_08600, partial [Ginsengibacter sp.]